MLDVDSEIRNALRSKDTAALNGYRSLKSKMSVKLTEAGREHHKPLSEDEVQQCIRREVREREEANEYYQPDHPQHAENAHVIELLRQWLPRELTAAELEAELDRIFGEVQPAGPRDMGKVMARLREVPGVDMSAASARVKERLQG